MTHTPEELAMARRIGAEHDPDKAYQYLDGSRDDYPSMKAICAAIQATTEAAAIYADDEADNCDSSSYEYDGGSGAMGHRAASYNISSGLRSGGHLLRAHLKGNPHD